MTVEAPRPALEPATAAASQQWRAALHALFSADPSSVAATRDAMHGLGLEYSAPAIDGRSVVYLLAHPLAGVPADLVLRNGRAFWPAGSGRRRPLAVVAARTPTPTAPRPRVPRLDPPPAPTSPVRPALALLADNLPWALPGFTTEVAFPTPPWPLEVAVLAAHGGTDAHDHYFSAIGDECAQHFSISRVAAALAGCELVVLFVCHGGHTAAAPSSTRSVGLPSACRVCCRLCVDESHRRRDRFPVITGKLTFQQSVRGVVGPQPRLLLAERRFEGVCVPALASPRTGCSASRMIQKSVPYMVSVNLTLLGLGVVLVPSVCASLFSLFPWVGAAPGPDGSIPVKLVALVTGLTAFISPFLLLAGMYGFWRRRGWSLGLIVRSAWFFILLLGVVSFVMIAGSAEIENEGISFLIEETVASSWTVLLSAVFLVWCMKRRSVLEWMNLRAESG